MERTLRALAAAAVLFGAVWAGNTALAQKYAAAAPPGWMYAIDASLPSAVFVCASPRTYSFAA
jgi:hypothetical protein